MSSSIERLEFSLSELEKGLNIGGYVPGVNQISGGLRIAIGKLQLISGLAIAAFAYLASELSSDPSKREKYEGIYLKALEHAKHGLANIVRGILEVSTPFYAGGLGIWLFYDMHHYRMEYEGEKTLRKQLGLEDQVPFKFPSFTENFKSISDQLISKFEEVR